MVRLAQLVEFMAVMVQVAVSNLSGAGGAGGTQEFLRKFAKSGKIKGPPFDL